MQTRLANRIDELLLDYREIPVPVIFTEADKIDPHWVEMRKADAFGDWYIVIAFSDGSQHWTRE